MAGPTTERLVQEVGAERIFADLGVDLEEVARNGGMCSCPFHAAGRKQDTPSFSVHLDSAFAKCFGCPAKGDLVDLLALRMGLDPKSAECMKEIEDRYFSGNGHGKNLPAAPPPAPKKKSPYSATQIRDYKEKVCLDILKTGIPVDPLAPYGVRRRYSGTRDAELVFPIHDPDGNLINLKLRRLNPNKDQFKSISLRKRCMKCDDWAPKGHACRVDHGEHIVTFHQGVIGLHVVGNNPEARLVLFEGEKDMATCAHSLFPKIVPVSFSHGIGNWPKGAERLFKDRDVVACADSDEEGRAGRKRWVVLLKQGGARVGVLDLATAFPEVVERHPKAKDYSDFLNAGMTSGAFLDRVQGMILEGGGAPPEKFDPTAPDPEDNRPLIIAGPDSSSKGITAVNQAEEALLASGLELFQKGGILVQVNRLSSAMDERPEPKIEPLGDARLRELLASSAQWVKPDGASWVLPPDWAVRVLMQRGTWSLPHLEDLVEAPFMRPDGTICETPGYDPATGVLYEPTTDYPPIPERPTENDLDTACRALAEPFDEVTWEDDEALTCVFAGILTLAGRTAIRGPVPMFAVLSPVAGSGKGLVTDCMAVIGSGRTAYKTPQQESERELQEFLFTCAMEGRRAIVLDNMTKPMQSPSLDSAVTSGRISKRILGVNKTASPAWKAVIFANGNNLQFHEDSTRRVIFIRIDPKDENPSQRPFRQRTNRDGTPASGLLEWVERRRAELHAAALTILRWFICEGKPRHALPLLGSFESWDCLVRACCMRVWDHDPVATQVQARSENRHNLTLGNIFRALYNAQELGPDRWFRADEVLKASGNPALGSALSYLVHGGKSLDASRLARVLAEARNKRIGGLVLDQSGLEFRVRDVTQGQRDDGPPPAAMLPGMEP